MDTSVTNREFAAALSADGLKRIFAGTIPGELTGVPLTDEARQLVAEQREQFRVQAKDGWLTSVAQGVVPTERSESSWSSDSGEEKALASILNRLKEDERSPFASRAFSAVAALAPQDPVVAWKLASKLESEIRRAPDGCSLEDRMAPVIAVHHAFMHNPALLARERYGLQNLLRAVCGAAGKLEQLPAEVRQDLLTLDAAIDPWSKAPAETMAQAAALALKQTTLSGSGAFWKEKLQDSSFIKKVAGAPELPALCLNVLRSSIAELNSPDGSRGDSSDERRAALASLAGMLDVRGLLPEAQQLSENERLEVAYALISNGQTERGNQVAERYELDRGAIAARGSVAALEAFDLKSVADIAAEFGTPVNQDVAQRILAGWETEIDRLVEEKSIGKAADLWMKSAALQHFLKTGATTESIASVMNLEPGYSGKVILVSVEGTRSVARGYYQPKDEFHSAILRGFEREMELRGLERLALTEVKGAHIRIPVEIEKPIVIHGKSEDYGECDKQELAALIRSAFPGREVETYREEN